MNSHSFPQEDQSLSTWHGTTNTSAAVTNVSKSFTNLLNEGIGQTTYMTAAHSSTIPTVLLHI